MDRDARLRSAPAQGAPLRIAIVGASARAAVQSARSAGFEAVAADLFADADTCLLAPTTRIADYPNGFAGWLAGTPCDGWMYAGGLENYPDLVDRMADLRPLWGCAGVGLRDVRNPFVLGEALRAAGLSVPETRPSVLGLPLNGEWLCKTGRGASGSGVWKLDSAEAQLRAVVQGAFAQRRAPGRPASALFLTSPHGPTLLAVTRMFIGSRASGRPFAYQGSFGPIGVSTLQRETLYRLGALLVSRFKLRGLVGVDLMIDGDRLWVLEVNPRYTAACEVVESSLPAPSVASHIAACRGEKFVAAGTEAPAPLAGKRIVYSPAAVRIDQAFHVWAMGRAEVGALADVPPAGAAVPARGPIATVLAQGAGPNAAREVGAVLLRRYQDLTQRVRRLLPASERPHQPDPQQHNAFGADQ